jgi:hypothetical protein
MNSQKSSNFEELLGLCKKIDQWLKSTGIDVDRTRWGKYCRQWESIVDFKQSNSPSLMPKEIEHSDDFFNLLFETHIWVEIHEGLKHVAVEALRARLFHALKSHHTFSSDSGAPSGRDFSYELYFGSLLSQSGINPVFPSGPEEPDLWFVLDGQEFLVECKRPRSRAGVARCVERSIQQLSRAYVDRPSGLGLLAICLDRLLNPELSTLVVKSPEDILSILQTAIAKFEEEFAFLWRIPKTDHRFLGTVITIASPFSVGIGGLPMFGSFLVVSQARGDALAYQQRSVEKLHASLSLKATVA